MKRTTVRYERNMRITETWLGNQLIYRRDEPLDNYVDERCLLNVGVGYIEYTDFTAQNQPRKVTEYGFFENTLLDFFTPTIVTSVTTMEYDENGVLLSESCSKPTGEKIYESEIVNGVKIQDVYAHGKVRSYEYDENGRLAKDTYGDKYNQQYIYDENGELTEILENNNGWKNIYEFKQGQLSSYDMQSEQEGFTATFERNENGQLVKKIETQRCGEKLTEVERIHQYDANGELVEEYYHIDAEIDGRPYKPYYTIKYSKGENGEKIAKENMDCFGGMPYYVRVLSADGTTACRVSYDADLQIWDILYAKKDPSNDGSTYGYNFYYSDPAGEWKEGQYWGTGIYSPNEDDTIKGTPPTADDPLLKYLMSIDPTADPAALMVMLAELDLTELEAIQAEALESEAVQINPGEAEPEAAAPEVIAPEAVPEANEAVVPAATEPVVTEPEVTEPEVTEPEVTEPAATEPIATEPVATEPVATEPVVTEPAATEPATTEPEVTEPEVTEPETPEPTTTEPAATEPEVTEPATTEPTTTEPAVTEPAATEPEVTEPVTTEPVEAAAA